MVAPRSTSPWPFGLRTGHQPGVNRVDHRLHEGIAVDLPILFYVFFGDCLLLQSGKSLDETGVSLAHLRQAEAQVRREVLVQLLTFLVRLLIFQ